jgi:hypothetical protein
MARARRSLVALFVVALLVAAAPGAAIARSPGTGVTASATNPTLRLDIANLEGFAYKPAPSDYAQCGDLACPFYDSDFANTDFRALWDSGSVATKSGTVTGRGDLRTMAGAGANFVRLYDWNAPPRRSHLPFLQAAKAQGLKVTIPFSLYFIHGGYDPNVRPATERIIAEIYTDPVSGALGTVPHPAANMWLIGNEVELSGGYATATGVAQVAEILYAWEQSHGVTVTLPISTAVSFGVTGGLPPAIGNMKPIIRALLASEAAGRLPAGFTKSRFIFGVNTTNPATFLETWLDQYKAYWTTSTDGLGGYVPPMFFSEMGPNLAASCNGYTNCTTSEAQQGIFARDIWNMLARKQKDPAYSFVRGASEFELTAEPWKGGEEATFGLWKFDPAKPCQKVVTEPYGKPAGATWTYCLDGLTPKGGWAYVVQAIDSLRDSVPPPPVRLAR